jgi:Holliday junction resolvasome RuvABC endonuclease subunit
MMVKTLLPGSGAQAADAADALAVAITHARVRLWARNLESAAGRECLFENILLPLNRL